MNRALVAVGLLPVGAVLGLTMACARPTPHHTPTSSHARPGATSSTTPAATSPRRGYPSQPVKTAPPAAQAAQTSPPVVVAVVAKVVPASANIGSPSAAGPKGSPVPPSSGIGTGEALANTGVATEREILAALALLGAGSGLTLLGRRRSA